MTRGRVIGVTALAMLAFAANSLLCRAALKHLRIDPATFTAARIFSGAVMLAFIARGRGQSVIGKPDWPAALALFAYAAAFSFAYVSLPAGTGALVLFGSVQATMILWGYLNGERLGPMQTAGFVAALAGLVALMLPGIAAPSPVGFALMALAGIAWGTYSLIGRRSARDPVRATASNFIAATPFAFALAVTAAVWRGFHADMVGVAYAVASGAIASGCGYVLWYLALPGLRAPVAASVQLSVPVIAACAGILLLGEPLTLRFVLASIAVLAGIAVVAWNRRAQRA